MLREPNSISQKVQNLCAVESGNAGKDTALEQLQRGTASSGDVRHLVGKTSLLDGGNGISSSNDGDDAFASQISESGGNGGRAVGELVELKNTHWAVPNDGLALAESILEDLDGLRTNIQAHPAIGDRIERANLRVGIRGKLVGHNEVNGQEEFNSLGLGFFLERLGQLQLVLLNEGISDGEAAGLVESEDHASSEDQLVALLEKRLDHADLGRDLGPADNSGERALGGINGTGKVFELLLEEESGHRRRQVGSNTGSRSVSPANRQS